MKRDLDELDAGQLDLMWSCLKLRKEIAYKSDVRALIRNLDAIRQAIVQMTGGEQAQSLRDYDAWERGEAIAHDYFRRTVALQQVYTNAVKGECENCKKMFGIMTGLIPPQNGGNT